MTKSSLLIAALTTLTFSSTAQIETEIPNNKWKISSIGGEYGFIRDSYQKMDMGTMIDFTKNPALLERDLYGYTENLYRTSSGVKLGLNVTLTSGKMTSNWSNEIRLGAFYSGREPMITYNSGSGFDDDHSSIIYCNVVNEISLDGAYIFRRTSDKFDWFSVYGGIGVNLGSSFSSKLIVMENDFNFQNEDWNFTQESYDAKSSVFSRVYLPVGMQFTLFKHYNLGLESNIGIGMQSVVKGRSYLMPLNTGLTAKIGYNF